LTGFGEIPEHRVRRLHVRPEGARAGRTLRLHPDDLAPQQHRELVLEDGGDVAGQRSVRLAAEVGDVDAQPTARFEDPQTLREHVAQHDEVLEVGGGDVAGAEVGLVRLAREVRR
jgi:hypothetical protein